jgi:hypothetical protein
MDKKKLQAKCECPMTMSGVQGTGKRTRKWRTDVYRWSDVVFRCWLWQGSDLGSECEGKAPSVEVSSFFCRSSAGEGIENYDINT